MEHKYSTYEMHLATSPIRRIPPSISVPLRGNLDMRGMCPYPPFCLVEEAGLLVLDAQFAVDGGEDALHLSEGEHASKEGIARVMTVA